jgi:hypothetical protein
LSISDTGCVVTKQLIFDLGFPEWSNSKRRSPASSAGRKGPETTDSIN